MSDLEPSSLLPVDGGGYHRWRPTIAFRAASVGGASVAGVQ